MHANDGNRAWIVVVLLFIFMVINFADKAVIGIAAVPIMQELELGPRQFGLVGSSFFLLFAVSSVATGFLVNRVQTRWVLLAMGLIWALTQFPMIGSVGFETLVACRIALGAGEGPASPVALHSAYKWFPNEQRTLPTAVIVQGGAIGVVVALPLLNWVIVRWTWHWAFGALGVVGLVWCALWLVFGREGSLDDKTVRQTMRHNPSGRVGYAQLLLQPHDLGVLGGIVRGQLGLVAGALVARRLPRQGSWPCAKLGRVRGSADGWRHCGRDARDRLVFATPAVARRLEQIVTRRSRRVERRARRRCTDDAAIRSGQPRQDRLDDAWGGTAFGDLRHQQCDRRRDHPVGATRRAARDRHRSRKFSRLARTLHHGQRYRERRDTARRVPHRLLHVRDHLAGGRRDRDGTHKS